MKTKSDRVCSLQCTSIEVPLLRTTVEKIEGKTLKFDKKKKKKNEEVEVRGFEPRTSRMQSERSTTELHPRPQSCWE